jgi:transposase
VGTPKRGEKTNIFMLTMYKQITIQTLHKQGVKQAAIAKQLGCHRNTVHNVLRRENIREKQVRVKPSRFDRYKAQIKEWLDNNITNLRIHELLIETYGIGQTYTTLCKYIQKQFPRAVEAFGVQQTAPGEEAELDFGYLGMLPGLNGKLVKTWGLAVVGVPAVWGFLPNPPKRYTSRFR